jgi:hypothetical protein
LLPLVFINATHLSYITAVSTEIDITGGSFSRTCIILVEEEEEEEEEEEDFSVVQLAGV